MVAAACSTPRTADPTPAPVLHAVIEQPSTQQAAARIFGPAAATRTSIDPAVQPHPILWSANDLISIHFNTDVNGGRRVYVLSSGAGTQHADFTYTQIYDTSDTDVTISADPPTDFTSLFAGYPGEYVTISAQNSELLIEPPREIFLGLDDVDAFPMIGTGGADGIVTEGFTYQYTADADGSVLMNFFVSYSVLGITREDSCGVSIIGVLLDRDGGYVNRAFCSDETLLTNADAVYPAHFYVTLDKDGALTKRNTEN